MTRPKMCTAVGVYAILPTGAGAGKVLPRSLSTDDCLEQSSCLVLATGGRADAMAALLTDGMWVPAKCSVLVISR